MRAGMRAVALALPGLLGCGGGGDPAAGHAGAVVPEAAPLPPFTVVGRWPDPGALRYRVAAADGPVPAATFAATVDRALAVWQQVDGIGFVRGDAAGDADVLFAWGDAASDEKPDAPFGRDTSVAMTGPVGPGCTVLFDRSRPWVEGGAAAGARLYQAAVHEIGHVLGLGHSEDPQSVLHAQRENGRTVLAPSDLWGLASLYGGADVADGPGDLFIDGGGDAPVLRRVAPPERSGWTVFDSDGDGDSEILIWERDDAVTAALTIYHFDPGARLERTVGPIFGFAGAGAEVVPCGDDARAVEVVWPDRRCVRRRFNDGGFPGLAEPRAAAAVLPSGTRQRVRAADLDGDGRVETVRAWVPR